MTDNYFPPGSIRSCGLVLYIWRMHLFKQSLGRFVPVLGSHVVVPGIGPCAVIRRRIPWLLSEFDRWRKF